MCDKNRFRVDLMKLWFFFFILIVCLITMSVPELRWLSFFGCNWPPPYSIRLMHKTPLQYSAGFLPCCSNLVLFPKSDSNSCPSDVKVTCCYNRPTVMHVRYLSGSRVICVFEVIALPPYVTVRQFVLILLAAQLRCFTFFQRCVDRKRHCVSLPGLSRRGRHHP